MKRLAIFDLDGTLVDSIGSIAGACNEALIKNGLKERSIQEYKYFAGDGALELVKRAVYASGDVNYEKLDDVYKVYKDIFVKDCTRGVVPFENIDNILKNLKDKGIILAVLSNKPHERTIDVVEKIFGNDKFDMVLGYKSEETKKPNPYGALLIANHFNIEPKDCVYIGDTDTDMQTGIRAGMYTVGVTWGFRDREELISNKANDVIDTPIDLLKYF
ncbi:HAD family hydrolase [uncultured Tyzzerella sp.]|uniref:HAD family hydrolase n=1 Tax=uncultured Tyzzerella sp. TaxID=2321398 RepID=UPI00294345C9|nr:HAD family hydrolase [uncultured Tyzzerella sp.]